MGRNPECGAGRPPSLCALPSYLAGNAARIGDAHLIDVLKGYGLTLRLHAVLVALDDFGSLAPHEISSRLQLRRAHVSVYVEALVERELVVRTTDEVDRRRVVVQITDSGADLVSAVLSASHASQEPMLAGLTERERGQLTALLRKAIDHADRRSVEPPP